MFNIFFLFQVSFFKNCLKFETDETSPLDDVYETFQYEIVSRLVFVQGVPHHIRSPIGLIYDYWN